MIFNLLAQPPSLQRHLLRIQFTMALLFILGAALFSWRMTVVDQTLERHFALSDQLRLLHTIESDTAWRSESMQAPGRQAGSGQRGEILSLFRALAEQATKVEADYRQQKAWVALSWTVMLLMPLALAFWPLRFSRAVIEGIEKLSHRVERGFAGQATCAASDPRRDEIGALGRAIDEMFADLRRRETEARLARQLQLEQQKLADVVSLVGGIAHEVANPLSVILANLDSLENGGSLAEIENIREGLLRIQHLLRDVDVFSAGDDGIGLVNINEVAASAFRVVRLDDRLRGNRLMSDLDPLIPAVPFSRTVMTLATFSLLSLAAAMVGGGKGGLSVSSGAAEGMVELRIRVTVEAGDESQLGPATEMEAHPTVLALGRVVQGYGGELMLPQAGEFRLRFPVTAESEGGRGDV